MICYLQGRDSKGPSDWIEKLLLLGWNDFHSSDCRFQTLDDPGESVGFLWGYLGGLTQVGGSSIQNERFFSGLS